MRQLPGGGLRVRLRGLVCRMRGLARHERVEAFVRAGVRRHRQRLGGLEREPVQALQRPYDGGAGPGAGGQLGEVAGHGREEVRAGVQQGGEVVVGAGAQLFGERAGRS